MYPRNYPGGLLNISIKYVLSATSLPPFYTTALFIDKHVGTPAHYPLTDTVFLWHVVTTSFYPCDWHHPRRNRLGSTWAGAVPMMDPESEDKLWL
jgi:hypothetical protein